MSFTRSFSGSVTAVSGGTATISPTTRTGDYGNHVTAVSFSITVNTSSGSDREWYLDNPAAPSTSTFNSFFCGYGSGTFTRTWTAAELADMPNAWNVFNTWPRTIRAAVGVIVTVTSMTLIVTASGDDTPDPPPPGPITSTVLKFVENLPDKIQYDTDYTVIFKAIKPDGKTHTYSSGTVTLQIQEGPTVKSTGFTVNGAAPASTPITFASGQSTCTLRFPSGVNQCAAETNLYLHTVKGTFTTGGSTTTATFGPVASPPSIIAGAGLKFTVQPPTVDDVGHVFTTPVQVSAVNAAGVVNTAWTGDIILTMKNLAGEVVTDLLGGTKTVAPTLGVSVFPGLFISKIGFYTLHATSTMGSTVLTGISTGITIVGDDGEQQLRQNLRDDSTIWVKTTNIATPTYGTFTTANLTTLDGDEAVTANVTFDGVRWCFPYTMKAVLVRFKVKVSTLVGAPTIALYSSQDTTTGQDGTWTLQTSMTPATTGVFIAQFALVPALYAKGLWLTLNDGGGAATADWYSTQVMGKYLGAPISYLATDVALNQSEHYVTVPAPLVTLGGAQQKFRSLQIRNNTASSLPLRITHVPARSTGDTLMDLDNFSILTDTLLEYVENFTLPAYASEQFILRYIVTAADNDKSKEHYARISLYLRSLTYGTFLHADSDGGTNYSMTLRDLDDASSLSGVSTGGSAIIRSLFVLPGSAAVISMGPNGPDTAVVQRLTLSASALSSSTALSITAWSASQETHLSGIAVVNDRILLSLDDSTTILYPPSTVASTYTAGSIARSTLSSFTIPAQTTGAKFFYPGPNLTVFIQNGTAANSVLYRINYAGTLSATIDPTVPFAGRGLRSAVWDDENNEVYVASSVSAGSRIISRYTKDGVLIASVSTTTQPTLEADGMVIVAPYVLVMYGGRYLYRHDLQTMANATLLWDIGALNVFTPGTIRLGV